MPEKDPVIEDSPGLIVLLVGAVAGVIGTLVWQSVWSLFTR